MKKTIDYLTRSKDLKLFLVLEVMTVPAVILIFKSIESRVTAGLIAGSLFIALGVFLFFKNLSWVNYLRSPVFWFVVIHLFFIAIPLLLFRTLNLDTPFEELKIIGIPGPTFHRISENVFTVLVVMTVAEFVQARIKLSKSYKI